MAQKIEPAIRRREKIGQGGFGVVYIGTYQHHKEVAIKDIKGHLSAEACHEANLLKGLTHPNIIQCIDILQDQDQMSIIMEYVDGGNLLGYIRRTVQSSMYWKTTKQILTDVAHGMSYLHSKRIVHADLKSLNVLLRHNYSALICDFGLARTISDSRTVLTSASSGTELWFAPELCFVRPERSSYPSDVWAYGCVILEIISQEFPWTSAYHNNAVLLNALAKEENASVFENICLKQHAPKKLRALLCRCCTWNKKERPKFDAIVRELSAISDSDLEDITRGKAKPLTPAKQVAEASSLPAKISKDDDDDGLDFKSVVATTAELNIKKASSEKRPSVKVPKADSPKASNDGENSRYDEKLGRVLMKGPQGGWYYLNDSGKKVYPKNKTA